MNTENFKYTLWGGPLDGDTGAAEDMDGGMADNLTFLHPSLRDLCVHYKFESMDTNDGTINYTYVCDFYTSQFTSYVRDHIHGIGHDAF